MHTAARFIQRYRSEPFFLSTPMLITAVEQRLVDIATLPASDSVIAFNLDFAAAISNILQVLPKTTDVAVIFGNSPLEMYWVEQASRELQSFTDRIKFTWLNEFSFDDIRQRVASLPPQSAIFYVLFAVDAAGVPHAGDRPLQELHAHAAQIGINERENRRIAMRPRHFSRGRCARACLSKHRRAFAVDAPNWYAVLVRLKIATLSLSGSYRRVTGHGAGRAMR